MLNTPSLEPMMAAVGKLLVEKVPAALVGILADEGKLILPPPPQKLRGFRRPGIIEIAAMQWLVAWDGRPLEPSGALRCARGAASFIDRYDFHSASDVRDITFLAGSRRAIVDLLAFLRFDAKEHGRRVIGTFDIENYALRKMVRGLGLTEKRIAVEDLT